MLNAHEGNEISMAPGLRENALARVDKQYGHLGSRGAGDHVPGVLLVTWRIGHDELSTLGSEEAVGHINGDALFPLRGQPIHQQGEVDVVPLRAVALGLGAERGQLIIVKLLSVPEEAADERALAIVDAATGNEAQKVLFPLLGEKAFKGGLAVRSPHGGGH